MKKALLLTNDYPPVPGGISTVFYHIWKYFPEERMPILTPKVGGADDFDRTARFRPLRFPGTGNGGMGKLFGSLLMAVLAGYHILFRGVREIHSGQILSSGPVGFLYQKLTGIPCFLWLYGGELSAAYQRSKFEERLVRKLIRDCRFLVTNSPATTREFLDYGIPRERIVEIIPAVDARVFTPGPRPEYLVRRHGLEGKRVLLTVARLARRKGHDLVLRALGLLGDIPDLRYIIVGGGEDRARLEEIVTREGLGSTVIFAGRVPESELPDYYRLCDLYVMPNREVPEVTDSLEGFGISFIEAAACGKPAIAGRSGGTDAAVVEGETGYLVDPEDPAELASKIRLLLDSPETRAEMGQRGRERVERDFTWRQRAEELANRLTIGPLLLREEAMHERG